MIVDAHLDLAANALSNRRDLTLPVAAIRAREPARRRAIAMTSLPGPGRRGDRRGVRHALRRAGRLVGRRVRGRRGLPRPASVVPAARGGRGGRIRDARYVRAVGGRGPHPPHHVRRVARCARRSVRDDAVPGLLVALEGADPVVAPERLERFVRRGLRIVGLAWGSTRYAGGTGSRRRPHGARRELLHAMADLGVIHDAAHLSEEAFWEAAALPCRGLCVSHATARAPYGATGHSTVSRTTASCRTPRSPRSRDRAAGRAAA